uniref:U21-Sparatoxin-Hju1c_1 n=1 Tax=Heteropoda jugulans TaxID=1358901 RepID=A0A4V2H9J7_9ARAC
MNSKLCILVVIALCLTLVHAGGKYCPEPKGGPCNLGTRSMTAASKATVQASPPAANCSAATLA